MKKLYFRATLDIQDYYKKNIMSGDNLFLCRYSDDWKKIILPYLRYITDINDKRVNDNKNPCVIEITIKPRLDDRTLKENALMWKIYEIQADILNREAQDVKNPVTIQELYDEDMKGYAPVHTKICAVNDEQAIIAFAEQGDCEYRGHLIDSVHDDDGYATIRFRETSSFWDTAKFSEFLEYKINELEQMGQERWNNGEVKALIDDFKAHLKEGEK